ncbi:MAG: 23S rRNA (pseudouridine(1915)-N(3))-methyltransferase RlmH [Lachnospiraceae bacterium]|nr:23S rRNA (pseudouridine(1915)-N(3))-methyltransferase RlmH [Lachnospiraceae bacterium]
MKVRILCIGKIKDEFYKNEILSLTNEIRQIGHTLEILEYPDEKIPDNLKDKNKELFIEKECNRMEKKITARDYVIALCIEGKEITTDKHRQFVKNAITDGYEQIVYVIGGSLGLSEKIKKRANVKLSFSKMTFPHQMMRMVLCEEILQVVKQ